MSRRDRRLPQTISENSEDRSDSSCRRNDVSSGIVYQTVSYDADDEKSSGSSLPTREPHPPLQSPPRKKIAFKRKKPVKPAAAAVVEDTDQLAAESSVTLVTNHKKPAL